MYTAEEVLAIIIGISAGGRGGGVNPENPLLGIPSFSDALAEDRARQRAGASLPQRHADMTNQLAQGIRALGSRRTPKKKRKVSKYQKEFGRQLKRLKKKHPRTPVTRLMKRAHAATRKAMK